MLCLQTYTYLREERSGEHLLGALQVQCLSKSVFSVPKDSKHCTHFSVAATVVQATGLPKSQRSTVFETYPDTPAQTPLCFFLLKYH